MKILSYSKFKKTTAYHRYANSIVVNMHKLGFSQIPYWEIDKDDSSVELAKQINDELGNKDGLLVWHRYNDRYTCIYFGVFYKTNKEDKQNAM